MDKKERFQCLELAHAVVRCVEGLHAFLALEPHSDIGRLDHVAVIGSISDRQTNFVVSLANQGHHRSLLFGRYSTANDRGT